MKILGINCSAHDTGVAYINNGEIVCALEEEKFVGKKSRYIQWKMPTDSLDYLLKKYNLTVNDFDAIAVSSPAHQFFLKGFDIEKTFFYSHHKCHNLGSYFTSGFEGKCISLSHDGKGETSRGKIYLCEDGHYEEIHSQDVATTASLAGIWGLATIRLGWKMLKDEGKVVGLAAHGKFDQQIYDWLKDCVYYDNNLNFKPAGWESRFWYIFNRDNMGDNFQNKEYRDNFAYTLEQYTEELMGNLLGDLHQKYPEYRKLCLSGGLFANVKLNQMINELDYFDEIFIHPAMGDSGLPLGAAICRAVEVGDIKTPIRLKDVYLGQDFTKEEWDIELNKEDVYKIEPFDYERIGHMLNNGKVLGLFLGRTEYGPRSLGNRSIIVKPTERETHERLNTKLKRTEIMPFAPVVQSEYSKIIFQTYKSEYTAEFMTMCYTTNKNWVQRLPAVIQELDNSARPQIIKKSVNEIYYNIIDTYRKISGIPVLLNTSFNAHGEPINNYPHQVLKHLNDEIVDYIITEDYIVSKK
jgi:carbamoyltransferase